MRAQSFYDRHFGALVALSALATIAVNGMLLASIVH